MKQFDTRYQEHYGSLASRFYSELQGLNISQGILDETPALFLPCYGELYEYSPLKIAVIGKETLGWANLAEASANPLWGNTEFRTKGPCVWRNQFWLYVAQIIGDIYGVTKENVLSKGTPFFPSIAWNNTLSIESTMSDSFSGWTDENDIRQLNAIQKLAKTIDATNIHDFIQVFHPNVLFFLYRNKNEKESLEWQSAAELLSTLSVNDIEVSEYKIGNTIIFHMPHPNYLVKGHVQADEMSSLIVQRMKSYNLRALYSTNKWYNEENCLPESQAFNTFVKYALGSIESIPITDFKLCAYTVIANIAVGLRQQDSTMTGVLMVRILNEIPTFKDRDWLYSEEGRGPLSTIQGAYNFFKRDGKTEVADKIARAFTKKDGNYAWD